VILFEDDYDFDFHFEGPPRLPLASADTSGVVVYTATMSKILAPGFRLAYVAATPDVTRRIASLRYYVDRQGDPAVERMMATLLEEGVVQQHARRARAAYRRRRDALCEALHQKLPELEFTSPAGGMAVWAQAAGIDVDAWVARALRAGVAFQAGRMFRLDGAKDDGLRIGFGACNEAEIVEAVRRMADARTQGRQGRQGTQRLKALRPTKAAVSERPRRTIP
jgi:GntR family transcriptional regulator/MocR family aminotransferase